MEHLETKIGEYAVILNDNNEFLILQFWENHNNKWHFPGGRLNEGDQSIEALKREVKEETGLDFNAHFLDYFDEILPQHGVHNVVLVFWGAATGAFKANTAEVSEMDWFPLSSAIDQVLAFIHNTLLESYASSKTKQMNS